MKTHLLLSLVFLACVARGSQPRAVIFDIDDTLVYTKGRTLKILHDVGADLGIEPLRRLRPEQVNYYCSVTCRNAGLTDAATIEKVCGDAKKGTLQTSEWGRRFFSEGRYLTFDVGISGAGAFVRRAARELGAKVIYLTGRNARALGDATRRQLARHGVPLSGTELVAKGEGDSADDVAYKREALARLRQRYTIVAVFDDSLGNANLFADELPPEVPVVRPVANTLDRKGVRPRIVQIGDYLVDRWIDPATGYPHERDNRAVLDAILRLAGVAAREKNGK